MAHPTYIASYPRSGNTMLRMLLHAAFGVRTGSVHPKESRLPFATMMGHDENGAPYMKTHLMPPSHDCRAIYVVRDGREVCVSLWRYMRRMLGQEARLCDVIEGRAKFGSWSAHVSAWIDLPGVKVVRFDDMLREPDEVVQRLSRWLGVYPLADYRVPTFDECHRCAPVFFASGRTDSWRDVMTHDDEELFTQLHGPMMERLGYMEHCHA